VAGLLNLAQRLRAAGVRRVSGAFSYDVRRFPQIARIEASQDDDASYDPALSALALDQNRVTVRWMPAAIGAVAAWSLPPGAAEVFMGEPEQPTHFARDPTAPERWRMWPRL